MLESHEIRQILDEVKQPLKSMVLLACNGALGNTDLSSVPLRAVDLDSGWLNFPRPKTAVPRRIPLWTETVASIKEWLKVRPKPKHADDKNLMFLTCRGARWVSVSENGTTKDAIIQEFNKVLKKLNLKRKRLSFYCLRHGFQTIGSETTDEVAVSSIMGHTDLSMAARYRERLNDDRLQKVVNHVHDWLFGDTDTNTEPDTDTDVDTTNEVPNNTSDAPALRLFAS
jgi:integrase